MSLSKSNPDLVAMLRQLADIGMFGRFFELRSKLLLLNLMPAPEALKASRCCWESETLLTLDSGVELGKFTVNLSFLDSIVDILPLFKISL